MLVQKFATIEMSHSRDHKFFSSGNHRWIGRDLNAGAQVLKGFFYGADVARAIVDNRDHKRPLVLGSILASCLSREQATRTARANALNRASIL